MKNLKLLFLTVISGSLFVVSCSKKGDTGPAGKTGATGATGPDSVIYSAPIRLAMNYWYDNINDWDAYVDSLGVSALTSTTVSQDVVLGYMYVPNPLDNNTDSSWVNIDNAVNFGVAMYPKVGTLILESAWCEWASNDFTGYQFRYIIIPANILASSSQLVTVQPTELRRMPYTQVMAALGIKNPAPGGNIHTATAQ